MFNNKYDNTINELKAQRKVALQSFQEARLVKNESLAEYFFCKFKEGKDVPYKILKNIPVGQALLLPVVQGGAIITTKEGSTKPNQIVYNTKWTSGSTLTLHYHSDCNEVIEVIDGKIKVFIQGNTHVLNKGDIIEVAHTILHQITALYESELKITFLKVLQIWNYEISIVHYLRGKG